MRRLRRDRHRAAGGRGGDRPRPVRRRPARRAAGAVPAAVGLRGHPGARALGPPEPRARRRPRRDRLGRACAARRAGRSRQPAAGGAPVRLHRTRLHRLRAAGVGLHGGHIVRAVGSRWLGAPLGHDQGPRTGRGVAHRPGGSSGDRWAMSWVDLVVVALALLAAISGWRHGMAVALLSFVGVLGGAIIGVRVAPLLAEGISNTNTRVIVSVAVVVMLVVLGETSGVFLGRRVRDRITGERFLVVASTLGSILQALAVVVAAWLVALPLATASLPGIAAGVRGSQVLSAVDSVMPTAAKQLPAELRQLLDNSGFPDVLSPFARTPVTATGPPNSALTRSPAAAAAQASVLKIRGKAPSCQRQLE